MDDGLDDLSREELIARLRAPNNIKITLRLPNAKRLAELMMQDPDEDNGPQ